MEIIAGDVKSNKNRQDPHDFNAVVCLPVAHGLMGNTMAATALDPTATARLSPGKAKGSLSPSRSLGGL